jgi:hypothetical protein
MALDIGTSQDREELSTLAVGKPAPMEHFDARRMTELRGNRF